MQFLKLSKVLLGVSALVFCMVADAIPKVYTQRGSNIAIMGLDPVAYFIIQEPTEGLERYSYEYNDAIWLFSSERNRQLFINDPDMYSPQYGGYCAYAVSRNTTASFEPHLFTIYEDKLYFNYNEKVFKRWQKKKDKYIKKANKNWPKLLEKS